MSTIVRTTYLHFKEGSSDKEYHVTTQLQPDGRYQVTARYGRSGSATNFADKGKSLDKTTAEKNHQKCVSDKLRKGYELVSDTFPTGEAPTTSTQHATPHPGPRPQLLTAVTSPDPYLDDDNGWAAERKLDGVRILVTLGNGAVVFLATNRNGTAAALPPALTDALLQLNLIATLDGELVDDTYHIFDLLELNGEDLRPLGYLERRKRLSATITPGGPLVIVPVYTDGKDVLLDQLRALKAEGIVFKRTDAPYVPGRGDKALKLKFWKTIDCVVIAHTTNKRSVALGLYPASGSPSRAQHVGHVTVKANQDIPGIGAIVSIKYLYATDANILYQPELLRERTDVYADTCTMDQLEYSTAA